MAETIGVGSMYPFEDLEMMKGLEHLTMRAERELGLFCPKNRKLRRILPPCVQLLDKRV